MIHFTLVDIDKRLCKPDDMNGQELCKDDYLKVTHYRVALPKIIAVWEKCRKRRPHISIPKMIHNKNRSSAIDWGTVSVTQVP